MKINKFKAFAYIGLGLSTLIAVNRITTVNDLKNGNRLNEVSTSRGITFNPYFNSLKVDEYSGRTDLVVVPETSTDISVIPEKGKIVKSEEFEADKFLIPEVDWTKYFPTSSGLTIDPPSSRTFFQTYRHEIYALATASFGSYLIMRKRPRPIPPEPPYDFFEFAQMLYNFFRLEEN